MHGNSLDKIMPRHRVFKKLFSFFHHVLMFLGFQRMHVAQYAKKWTFLYQFLNRHVAEEALRAAREKGFEAVTCGHTHAAMEMRQDGRRYLNTGAWTEEPLLTSRSMHGRSDCTSMTAGWREFSRKAGQAEFTRPSSSAH